MYQDRDRRSALNTCCTAPALSAVPIVLVAAARCMTSPSPRTASGIPRPRSRLPCKAGLIFILQDLDISQARTCSLRRRVDLPSSAFVCSYLLANDTSTYRVYIEVRRRGSPFAAAVARHQLPPLLLMHLDRYSSAKLLRSYAGLPRSVSIIRVLAVHHRK